MSYEEISINQYIFLYDHHIMNLKSCILHHFIENKCNSGYNYRNSSQNPTN